MKTKKILLLTLIFGVCLVFSFVLASKVQAAAGSQCTGACGSPQTGCVDNWPALENQCNDDFYGYCSGIAEYLSAMAADCVDEGQSSRVGGDCAYITSGNHYGACASIYASYVESWDSNNCTDTSVGGTCKAACSSDENSVSALGCATNESCCVIKSILKGTGIEIPTGTGLPDPEGGIAQIIRNLLTWLLGIVGVIAIIGFVISGVQYLTSAGSEERMESAKRNMLYAIIGVIVALASFVIVQAIQYALEARSMF